MFYFGNMDGGNSKCGDGDSMAIITSAAFGSSVALAEATWARSSGVHKGLPSDQLPRHLSYHWADESKRSKASQNRSQVHFRIFDQQVCQFLIVSLSLGPNLGPTFLSKRILPKIASSKINLWVFHGFSMFLFWENFDPSLSQPGSPGSLAWGFRIFSSRTRSPPASRTSSTLAAENLHLLKSCGPENACRLNNFWKNICSHGGFGCFTSSSHRNIMLWNRKKALVKDG